MDRDTIGLVELAGGGTGQYRHPAPVHRLVDDPCPKRRLAARGVELRGLPVAHYGDKELRIHPQIAEGGLREPADLARRVVDLAGLVLIDRFHPALEAIDAIRRHEDLTLRGKRHRADVQLPHDDLNRKSEEEQGEAGAPLHRAHATTRAV